MKIEKAVDETTYPSVELAYDISLKAYDWAIQRLDAIDNRLDALLAWFSGITLGVISIIASKDTLHPSAFKSCWFYLSIALFSLILIFSFISKMKKELTLVSPKNLYNDRLHMSVWEFRKNAIYDAGRHFDTNCIFIAWKAKWGRAMIACFILEMVFMGLWIISFS